MAIDHDDEADFFAPPEEQRTLFQEGMNVETGKWVGAMPEPAAPALYTPNEASSNPGDPGADEYLRKAAESMAALRRRVE